MQKTNELGLVGSGGQAKTRPHAFTIGICATGRPRTLPSLLDVVLSTEVPGFPLRKVVLVASECDQETLRAARKVAAMDRRVVLIEHERRTGKADALNEVFRHAEGDLLVYVNADAMVLRSSIPALLKRIEREPGTGFISGMPTFQRPGGFISDVLDVMWTSQNILASEPSQRAQSNHGTDELMVIRTELLPELPAGVVNDGAYIAGKVRETGFSVGFEPDAVVQIDVPRRMLDLIRQRRRILFGHIQVKRLVGKAPRTVETMMFFDPGESARVVIRMMADKPRLIPVLPAAAFGELIALSGALWDTFVSSASHAVWKRYEQG